MKGLLLLTAIGCSAFLSACQTTDTAGGNQEAKRRAQIAKEERDAAAHDESTRNLWNAHRDILTRDNNVALRYY